jgi:hypothetical protein
VVTGDAGWKAGMCVTRSQKATTAAQLGVHGRAGYDSNINQNWQEWTKVQYLTLSLTIILFTGQGTLA